MLRSPTHLVGHGPTSTTTGTTGPTTGGASNTSFNRHHHLSGGGGHHHHHHLHQPHQYHHQNITNHQHQHTNGHTTTTTKNTTPTANGKNGDVGGSIKNGGGGGFFFLNGGAKQQQITLNNNNNSNNNNNTNSNNNNHTSSSLLSASARMSPTSHQHQTATATATQTTTRTSLFDSCHRKIRLIGGGPVAFLGGLVAKARRKERDGDQNSTDTKLYLEESVLERKLPEADLKALVDLPAGLDYNEWLASHTLALFEHVNLVYGTISEFCTPSGCPDMTGPGNRTYLWFDEKGKKTRVAAPQYIDYVMTFTQKTVSDESIFPTKYANEFPSSFESIARKILRLQFHVIAHLYAAHFREIALLGLHTHLNLTFAHLTALHRRFTLIDEKETDVLRDLEVALRLTDDSSNCSISDSTTTLNTSGGGGGAGGSNNATTAATHTAHYHHQNNQSATAASAAMAAYATTAAATTTAAAAAAGGVTTMTGTVIGASEDVNLLQSGVTTTSSTISSATGSAIIDGDALAQPICTQPEAATKTSGVVGVAGCGGGGGAAAVFGGGGGLMGGILGDFTSNEFSDTTGYCAATVAAVLPPLTNTNNGGIGGPPLNLNFNNNHQAHQHHLQHAHAHAHHYHQQQQQQHSSTQQITNNSLLQCNNSSNNSTHTTTTA